MNIKRGTTAQTKHSDNLTLLKRSLHMIQVLRRRLEQHENVKPEPIAIIGMACRFPGGCSSPDKFWRFLKQGGDGVVPIPPERWNADEFYSSDTNLPGKMYVKEAGFLLEDVGEFDARFFNISPREAVEMDPQHRLLLEVSWEALESAGQTHKGLKGSQTGVFVGITGAEYPLLPRKIQKINPYIATGSVPNIASGRIAHIMGLHGPALSIDTACSSSLVSVHLACESLRQGESNMALAGGVNLMLSPYTFAMLCSLGALSKDGRCKTFDADGNGYGRGEGCGMVVLKRLSSAQKDNDPILAVINGSAMNHDGSTGGLTVPNGLAQERLLRKALENARLMPEQIDYIETHGTGTALGDPIEVHAITEVFGKKRTSDSPLILGAVKANIGHLEAAAGIAGLIKTVLCLNHKQIPPQLHLTRINPKISLEKIPANIPDSLIAWSANGKSRIAGVSSFGFSGTNAHVIVSEPSHYSPDVKYQVSGFQRPLHILTLSAKNDDALRELALQYKVFLDAQPNTAIADICYTANSTRAHFPYRAAFIAKDVTDMQEKLGSFAPGNKFHDTETSDESENAAEFFYGKSPEGGISPIMVVFSRDSDTVSGYARKEILDLPSTASPEQWNTLLKTLGRLYCTGAEIDWHGFDKEHHRRRMILPSYPFQRKRYWVESLPFTSSLNIPAIHPKKEDKLRDFPAGKQIGTLPGIVRFEYALNTNILPEIKDNSGVVHVGYYQEMLCRAVTALYNTTSYTLKEMDFFIALYLPDDITKTVHLEIETHKNKLSSFKFYSQDSSQKFKTMNARGSLELNERLTLSQITPEQINAIQKRCPEQMQGSDFYKIMQEQRGMSFGPSIRWIEQIWYREGEALAQFRRTKESEKNTSYALAVHPGIWDACAQVYFSAFSKKIPMNMKFMMVKWENFVSDSQKKYDDELWCHVVVHENPGKDGMIKGKFHLFDKDGHTVAQTGETRMNVLRADMVERIMMGHALHEQTDEEKAFSEKLRASSETDQQVLLQDYFLRKMASILDMPVSELNVKEPLSNLGMDSIVGLEFKTAIENSLNIEIPIETLIQGPSISELADNAVRTHTLSPVSLKKSGRLGGVFEKQWISYRKKNPLAKLRLFCFPYGTAGASIYRRWQQNLPESIEVCPIQLPGRESRFKEMPPLDIEEMIDMLEKALAPELDMPYALYGHSAGALIAFRLAYRLWKNSEIKPNHLFAGAFTSPVIPNPIVYKKIADFKAAGFQGIPDPDQITDENFNLAFNAFSEPELEQLLIKNKEFLKRGAATLKMVESYYKSRKTEEPFDIPLTVFHGKDDAAVSAKDMEAWKTLTSGRFKCHILPGDHLFLTENQSRKRLLELITNECIHDTKEIIMSDQHQANQAIPVSIPIPSNFPVKWENPDDAKLFWQQDKTHYSEPVTPMDFSVLVEAIFEEKAQHYEFPVKTYYRHINTYLYYAIIFKGSPAEMEAAFNRAMEKITPVMEKPDKYWENEWLPEIKTHLSWWETCDLKNASVSALLQHLDETDRRHKRSWEIHNLLITPLVMAINQFDEIYHELFSDAGQAEAFDLLSGFETKVFESDQALWKLSRQALASPEVHKILTGNDAADVMDKLADASDGRAFLTELQNYLQTYGRCCYKSTLSLPFWIEDPLPVIKSLQDTITQAPAEPMDELNKMKERREQHLAKIRNQLQGYPKPVVEQFEASVKAAQISQVIMSDHTYWIDNLVTYQVRRVMLEFGRRLAENGCFETIDDVFYLTFEELKETAKRLPEPTNHRNLIHERRALEKQFAANVPPPCMGAMPAGPPPPNNLLMRTLMKFAGVPIPPSPDAPPNELKGHPASAGCIQGTARVIRKLSDAKKLKPGDILVTEFTLPSWTPIFANIAAVVTDSGGILSHSAIVAREYGIPAVVGTVMATTVIQDGQRIEVNGDKGVVRIIV